MSDNDLANSSPALAATTAFEDAGNCKASDASPPATPASAWWVLVPALVAVLIALPILGNAYALDDASIIETDLRYRDWRALPLSFLVPYWPPPFAPNLYRPFTTILLHLQRFVGGGDAWAVHLGSMLAYGVLTAVTVRFALPRTGALAAAAAGLVFALHPIHTEAVAEGVNQADLLVAVLYILSTGVYVRLRSAGALRPRAIAQLVALHLVACFIKETGVLLPAAWLAAEATLVRDERPWRTRVATLRPTYLLFALAAVAFVAVRGLVLEDVKGSFSAQIFVGSTLGGRALTMLGVVPELARLLLWPAHLRTDYSTQEFVAPTAWGMAQTAGLAILAGLAVILLLAWRRDRLAAFGLLLAIIGFGPVHNVLLPTGILIGERTLLLPSVGLALALASMLARLDDGTRRRRVLVGAPLLLLLLAGAGRMLTRWPSWHDQRSLWEQAFKDSPDSWQANLVLGAYAASDTKLGTAEALLKRAAQLNPTSAIPLEELAQIYRKYDRCEAAIPLYGRVLKSITSRRPSRAGLVTCALWIGDYELARATAIKGAGWHNVTFRTLTRIADSAIRVQAPPKSVTVADSVFFNDVDVRTARDLLFVQ